jgi:hypothetical protein
MKEDEMGRACSTHGRDETQYNILVGKPGWKGPLERPRRRCEDNIRIDLRKIRWEGADWMHLAQDRDQTKHGNEPLGSVKGEEYLD